MANKMYQCVRRHYDSRDRGKPFKERRIIEKGTEQEFSVPPRSASWVEKAEEEKPAPAKRARKKSEG